MTFFFFYQQSLQSSTSRQGSLEARTDPLKSNHPPKAELPLTYASIKLPCLRNA